MDEKILQEQLAYYRARAQEYDESVSQTGRFATAEPRTVQADQEWTRIVQALHRLERGEEVLELACGTGIWTKELLQIGGSITALDGAAEMIEVNRRNAGSNKVQYERQDLFAWEPAREYDLVFFAFWLSHIPPHRLPGFLDKIARATKSGGRVFIVDEPAGGNHISGPNENGLYQTRALHDGRTFQIVKVYYDPALIQQELQQHGFQGGESIVGEYFFYLCATRS